MISKRHRPDFSIRLHRSPTSFTCLSSPLRFDPHASHASRFPLADRSADGSCALSLSLSPPSFPRERKAARLHTAPLHRGAIGLSVSSATHSSSRKAARQQLFCASLPSHSVYREEDGSPCRDFSLKLCRRRRSRRRRIIGNCGGENHTLSSWGKGKGEENGIVSDCKSIRNFWEAFDIIGVDI